MTGNNTYQLLLFVADNQPNSTRARQNIDIICREHLGGDVNLKIIDVFQDPNLALENRVYVTPMLVKAAPLPPAYVAGDLSDTGKVLAILGIHGEQG